MNPPVITKLRDMVPLRPLRYLEALRLAEMQAERFLELIGLTEPSVPERVITELPRLLVTRLSPFPSSGASQWSNGRWLVVINAAEPATRQRFSLAHELKHIIDHRFVRLMYLYFPETERHDMTEQICDYFAGCLLMPRPWVKRAYDSGTQDLPRLAQVFGVSQAAMAVRLSQIGLGEPTRRCLSQKQDWGRRGLDRIEREHSYRRRRCYVT